MSWLLLTVFALLILAAGLAVGYAFAAVRYAKYRAQAEAGVDLATTFKAVAGDVLKGSNQAFIELATQNLGKFQSEAKSELDKKQQAFVELV